MKLKKEHKNGTLQHPKKGEIRLGDLKPAQLKELASEPGYKHLFVAEKPKK